MTEKKLDRRIVRTRAMLQKALIELIDEQSYDSIGVGNIVDRATLRRATFYLHYPDKDSLLWTVLESNFTPVPKTDVHAVWDEQGSPSDKYFWSQLFTQIAEHRPRWKNILSGTSTITRRMQTILGEWLRKLPGENTVPHEVVAQARAGSVMALLIWWLETDSAYTPDEMAMMIQQLFSL